jgi:signal transduction histidine kinase
MILQKALNSFIKHSLTDRVQVSLNKVDDSLELEVEDNGIGFDVDEILSRNELEKGVGLANMKEGEKLPGGTFLLRLIQGHREKIRTVRPLTK